MQPSENSRSEIKSGDFPSARAAPSIPGSPSTLSNSPTSVAPTISQPKGGGALRGVGEKFAAVPSTGAATLNIPISCPTARANSTPSLSLNYSSGNGNGPMGLGWSLSFLSISRKTDKGVPRYDEEDVFILSGLEDLVPCDEPEVFIETTSSSETITWKVLRFRARVESDNFRVEHWLQSSGVSSHWRITNRENITTVLGYSDSARIYHPEYPERIYSWLIEEVRDDCGNVTLYQYKTDDTSGLNPEMLQEQHRLDSSGNKLLCAGQRYLKRALYGNRNLPQNLTSSIPSNQFIPIESNAINALGFCFHVLFDYGEHGQITRAENGAFETRVDYDPDQPNSGSAWSLRSDPFSTYRPGFELRTYRICKRILIFHDFPELGKKPQCVSQQVLSYENRKHLTRLIAFEVNGFTTAEDGLLRGDSSQATPVLNISYSDSAPASEVNIRGDINEFSLPAVTGSPYRWVDLDGEGLAGVLYSSGNNWFYRRNLGQGTIAEPVLIKEIPTSADINSGQVQLMDVDADGRLDLVELAGPNPGFYSRIPGDGWSPRKNFQQNPLLDRNNRNLRYVDLTGDGLADILITEADCLVWLASLGQAGFDGPKRNFRTINEDLGPIGLFDDGKEQLLLADMSGDGLVDLVRIRNGSVCYWPSLGYGRFGHKITMAVPNLFDRADQFDTKRIRLADVDGSGTVDVIYLHHDRAVIYANLSGNELAQPIAIPIPRFDNFSQIDVQDILGNGTACIVWSSPLPGDQQQSIRVIELMGGIKPHLLTRVDNGFGGITDIQYTTSTHEYLKDRAQGHQWLTNLPFPVQVVSKVVKRDEVDGSQTTTRYSYRHGYFDGHEREFRGFGFVEQTDAEAFPLSADDSQKCDLRPPAVTRTWFHTGAWLEAQRLEEGFAAEYFSGDSRAHRLPDTQWPKDIPSWEIRDLVRGFKGRPLRVEIYACDTETGALDSRPYSVAEHSYSAELIQPSKGSHKAIVRVDTEQTLTYHYERNILDPRITHDLVLQRDEYGHPLKSISLAYPRRKPIADAQAKTLAKLTHRWVVNDTQERFRLGVLVAEESYEITGLTPSDGKEIFSKEVLDSEISILDKLPSERRLISASVFPFWNDDISGELPIGEIGSHALPCGRLDLAFDAAQLSSLFLDEDQGSSFPEDDLTALIKADKTKLGYTNLPKPDQQPNHISLPTGENIWWRLQGKTQPNPKKFFTPSLFIDSFGAQTKLVYDNHALILTSTLDPRQNKTTATIDYRVLSAKELIDPNGNKSQFAYEPNGKLSRAALLGKGEGDTLDEPTLEYRYATRGYTTSAVPMYVQVWEREQHVNARKYQNDQRRQRFEYTDGSGRAALIMQEAEPGQAPLLDESGNLKLGANKQPLMVDISQRWVGSGRIIYDNKGNPVRKYEPFFWPTQHFPVNAQLRQWGVSPVLHYDPLSRLICTDNPDGSFARVYFSPWHLERWDEVDTALVARDQPETAGAESWLTRMERGSDAQKDAASKTRKLAGTPQTEHFDALGHVIRRTTSESDPILAAAKAEPTPYLYTSQHLIDIQGNEFEVKDTTGRKALKRVFDMLGRPIMQQTPESGRRWTLLDAADQVTYAWSERGLRWRTLFDALHRPTHKFIRWPKQNDGRDPLRPLRFGTGPTRSPTGHRGRELLTERLYYGEDMPEQEAKDANLLGHLTSHFDSAGHLRLAQYDFKGNVTEQYREICTEFRNHIDWSALKDIGDRYKAHVLASRLLDSSKYTTTALFDARNRILEQRTPDNRTIQPSYSAAGLLETLDVVEPDGKKRRRVIDNIDYNARGQRLKIVYGAKRPGAFQVLTRYTYDPLTFRLQELYSWRDGLFAYPYQHLAYTYDPVGNITSIEDTTAKRTFSWRETKGLAEGGANYTYDALYQLIEATGRELPSAPGSQNDPLADTTPHPDDLTRLRRYTDSYTYDRNGNLTRTKHTADSSTWVRTQTYDSDTNQLTTLSSAGLEFTHEYDKHGNTTSMSHLALMEWGADDQLLHVARNAQQHVWFTYDAAGQRVRKVFEAGNTLDETLYLGGYELHIRKTGSRRRETSTLHLMDGEKRVGLVETVLQDDFGELVRGTGFRNLLADHLGSTSVECDETGASISYEEFRPFGTTAFSSSSTTNPGAAKRRYRFTGKERDEETGLHYFGARYYSPWLSRWISNDPLIKAGGRSPTLDFRSQAYVYVNNRPTIANDPDGQLANIVIGAAIGAALGAAVDLGMQFASGAHKSEAGINWRSVAASATGGAVSGALAGATLGTSLVAGGATTGLTAAATKAASAGAADAVAGAASRIVAGERLNEVIKGASMDFAIGFATAGIVNSKAGSKFIKSISESSIVQKAKIGFEDAARLISNERGSINIRAKVDAKAILHEPVELHHPWPMYLGGPKDQLLEGLPKSLHREYHKLLDETLGRWDGGKFYQSMSSDNQLLVLEEFKNQTQKFDAKHGTSLWEAAVREGINKK